MMPKLFANFLLSWSLLMTDQNFFSCISSSLDDENRYEMQGGRGRAHSFFDFGDPFAGMSSPFDEPCFTNPFESTLFGPTRMGAYYTSSTTRRDGSDGFRFEEHKEADSVTGQAAHRISRGIHDKGHTLLRHLQSDGHVDTMQTLHNINEVELTPSEEASKEKAIKHFLGWMGSTNAHNVGIEGSGEPSSRGGGLALMSTENMDAGERRKPGAAKYAHSSKVRKR